MAIRIKRIHYTNLWISEYHEVALQTIKIIEKYDTTALHLNKNYDELIALKQLLESLKVYIRKNAMIPLLGTLNNERNTLLDAFRNVVKALRHVELPEKRIHMELLNRLLANHHAETIASDTRAAKTNRIIKLANAITANKNLTKAIDALALDDVVLRLFASNNEYENLFLQYITQTGAEEKIDTAALRREGNRALKQFFDAIEYCAYEYGNMDYIPLANELNLLNGYYIVQLKARATRSKNKGNGSDAASTTPIAPPAVPDNE